MKAYRIIILFLMILSHLISNAQIVIEMKNENGVYTMPCEVNGLRLRFIFDTGASNVSISLSEAIFMLKNGYLNEADLHGSSYSQIANGEIVENTTINIRELEIGGIKLHNIEAIVIHELNAPLLLGQSAIKRLGKIQIEDDKLLIMNNNNNNNSQSNEKDCTLASTLIDQASEYSSKGLSSLSSETYQKAYNLCPNSFDGIDLTLMAISFVKNNEFSKAIKQLELAANCKDNDNFMSTIYNLMATSYKAIKDFETAKLYCEKAIAASSENENISPHYVTLGDIYFVQDKYRQAFDYYKKSENLYLQYSKISMKEILKGDVRDLILGEIYFQLALCSISLDNNLKEGNMYMIYAALCGDEKAKSYCLRFDVKYDKYVE